MASDPTYPLRPISNLLAALLLIGVIIAQTRIFTHSPTRIFRTANFLRLVHIIQNISDAVSAIIWSNNADIKLHGYCDIVSRLQLFTYMTRYWSLSLVVRYMSRDSEGSKSSWSRIMYWFLIILFPAIIAGPLYYIVQDSRFEVLEGFGCTSASTPSVLTILLVPVCAMIPTIMCVIYMPALIRLHGELRSFRARSPAARILSINAGATLLFALPMGILSCVLWILDDHARTHTLPFYPGWHAVHSHWTPRSVTYTELRIDGNRRLTSVYVSFWSTPLLTFVIAIPYGIVLYDEWGSKKAKPETRSISPVLFATTSRFHQSRQHLQSFQSGSDARSVTSGKRLSAKSAVKRAHGPLSRKPGLMGAQSHMGSFSARSRLARGSAAL